MEGGPLFPYFAIDKSFVRSLNMCNFISAVAKAFALLQNAINSTRQGRPGVRQLNTKIPEINLPINQNISYNSCKIPKLRKPQYTLCPKLVVSEVRSTRPSLQHSNTCGAKSHALVFETINRTHQSLSDNLIQGLYNKYLEGRGGGGAGKSNNQSINFI